MLLGEEVNENMLLENTDEKLLINHRQQAQKSYKIIYKAIKNQVWCKFFSKEDQREDDILSDDEDYVNESDEKSRKTLQMN